MVASGKLVRFAPVKMSATDGKKIANEPSQHRDWEVESYRQFGRHDCSDRSRRKDGGRVRDNLIRILFARCNRVSEFC